MVCGIDPIQVEEAKDLEEDFYQKVEVQSVVDSFLPSVVEDFYFEVSNHNIV